MKFINKSQKRKVSLLFIIMLLASLCLSVIFVHHHVDHNCEGDECPVCAVIQMAKANMQNLNLGSHIVFQIQHFSLISFYFLLVSAFIVSATPVSEKIKLNN